jgi:hypothetical protein
MVEHESDGCGDKKEILRFAGTTDIYGSVQRGKAACWETFGDE